jgi:hypothetical protein
MKEFSLKRQIENQIARANKENLNKSQMATLRKSQDGKMLAVVKENFNCMAIVEIEKKAKKALYIMGEMEGAAFIKGVTRDCRIKNLIKFWQEKGYEYEVIDSETLSKYLK